MAMWQARSNRPWYFVGAAIGCVTIATVSIMAWRSRHQDTEIAHVITGGDAARAEVIMRRYGCGGCHTIPGIAGADGQVGPPLSGLIHRVYIGGVATNSSDHLIQWIVAPQRFSSRSAMPATGISEAEARDVAAYLYSK